MSTETTVEAIEAELQDAAKWSKLKAFLVEKHMQEQVEFYEKYAQFIAANDDTERNKLANEIIMQCLTQPSGDANDVGQYCLPDQPNVWPMIKRMKSRLIKAQDAKDDEEKIVYPKDFFSNVYEKLLTRIADLWEEYKA